MKLPREVSGARLADILCREWQYTKVHQVGSHIILETTQPTHHRIAIRTTIPSDSERLVQSLALSPSMGVQRDAIIAGL